MGGPGPCCPAIPASPHCLVLSSGLPRDSSGSIWGSWPPKLEMWEIHWSKGGNNSSRWTTEVRGCGCPEEQPDQRRGRWLHHRIKWAQGSPPTGLKMGAAVSNYKIYRLAGEFPIFLKITLQVPFRLQILLIHLQSRILECTCLRLDDNFYVRYIIMDKDTTSK